MCHLFYLKGATVDWHFLQPGVSTCMLSFHMWPKNLLFPGEGLAPVPLGEQLLKLLLFQFYGSNWHVGTYYNKVRMERNGNDLRGAAFFKYHGYLLYWLSEAPLDGMHCTCIFPALQSVVTSVTPWFLCRILKHDEIQAKSRTAASWC